MNDSGRKIDINCDLGEGYPHDDEVMGFISSANIACGGHAGNHGSMRRAVWKSVELGVRPGAHPGYPDRENFGRVEKGYKTEEISGFVLKQISILFDICKSEGTALSHIKLHGALYNRAALDYNLMYRLSKSIYEEFGVINIFTLAGSVSVGAVRDAGLVPIREAFADRAYNNDMTLVKRGTEGAVIEDINAIARRAVCIAGGIRTESISNDALELEADTICIHGDSPGAVATARVIRDMMVREGIEIGI